MVFGPEFHDMVQAARQRLAREEAEAKQLREEWEAAAAREKEARISTAALVRSQAQLIAQALCAHPSASRDTRINAPANILVRAASNRHRERLIRKHGFPLWNTGADHVYSEGMDGRGPYETIRQRVLLGRDGQVYLGGGGGIHHLDLEPPHGIDPLLGAAISEGLANLAAKYSLKI